MRGLRNFFACVCFLVIMAAAGMAQNAAPEQSSVCTFDDGKQISLRYPAVKVEKKLPSGAAWTPGEKPIFLFSQTELDAGGTTLAPKAYRIFLVPENGKWTLLINDNVDKDAHYSKEHDVARVPMDTGKLSQAEPDFEMALGHTGPKRCSLRVYYGTTGAFAAIQEK